LQSPLALTGHKIRATLQRHNIAKFSSSRRIFIKQDIGHLP